MKIQPKLIRDEKIEQLKQSLCHDNSSNSNLAVQTSRELIGHILAQDKFIEELLEYRKSFYEIALRVLGLSLIRLKEMPFSDVEKRIRETSF